MFLSGDRLRQLLRVHSGSGNLLSRPPLSRRKRGRHLRRIHWFAGPELFQNPGRTFLCAGCSSAFGFYDGLAYARDRWATRARRARAHPRHRPAIAIASLQIAVHLRSRVIVTATKEEHLKKAEVLGSAHGILETSHFEKEVRQLTAKRGVDVAVDCVGGEYWSKTLACLARGGRVATCADFDTSNPPTDLRRMFWTHLSVFGCASGTVGTSRKRSGLLNKQKRSRWSTACFR